MCQRMARDHQHQLTVVLLDNGQLEIPTTVINADTIDVRSVLAQLDTVCEVGQTQSTNKSPDPDESLRPRVEKMTNPMGDDKSFVAGQAPYLGEIPARPSFRHFIVGLSPKSSVQAQNKLRMISAPPTQVPTMLPMLGSTKARRMRSSLLDHQRRTMPMSSVTFWNSRTTGGRR